MDKVPSIEYFRIKGLLPFQTEFAVKFLRNKKRRYWQLASPVGTGKTRLAAAIIAHELEGAKEKKVLVLSPASLLNQWQSQISEMISSARHEVTAKIIDRKTYLELESRVPVGQSPWPSLGVIVMSIDLAKREDMAKNLVGANWDLAIIDESHLITGQRRKLFDRLVKSQSIARGLLLTATPLLTLRGVATQTVNWHNIIDWDGQLLYPSFRKTAVILEFERTTEEKGILRDLVGFASELGQMKPYGRFQSWILLRAAASCMFALEESLHRLQISWRSMRNK
ncbi:MAG: DEAD/DEAH box helicase family protein, partial [Candidatus Roizmanbacteria bacterium]|nr:DEAD/DEAH box helicase family protein [Candidatus Roizmanbacteria bacterium]